MLRSVLLMTLCAVVMAMPRDNGRALRGENDPIPTEDAGLLHQVGDFFKGKKSLHPGMALRGENDPYPTADAGLLHQVGDFFKGKKALHPGMALRGENDPYPTEDAGLLHQVGDFFKGKKSLHQGSIPVASVHKAWYYEERMTLIQQLTQVSFTK
ncbi:uncharacterized protein LOC110448051 isoform X2 [Mizuhopecten yessoensis]|uniref:uncharacterized protein LOC110448051 isoform X2 n=1 Tax=Mizuhopecten yessoensis TaxID=6573 RepID=UPI000B4576A0|nr:uncharacterized protein LOC110448051 isoform X2 [Mizuhopecten yessoensis]